MSTGGDGGAKKTEPQGSGGGGGGAKKVELKPHPVMEQLADVQCCVQSHPPWCQFFMSLLYLYWLIYIGVVLYGEHVLV